MIAMSSETYELPVQEKIASVLVNPNPDTSKSLYETLIAHKWKANSSLDIASFIKKNILTSIDVIKINGKIAGFKQKYLSSN